MMEQSIEKEQSFFAGLLPALMICGVALAMVIIVYGSESVAPGVHDTFHDARHAIGMPCH
tara:strand:- start:15900 stop:16079 length:180 start_codon:yes stop_codon:yes gene_type:complete